jgi:predicted Ser/Thr protein kinase
MQTPQRPAQPQTAPADPPAPDTLPSTGAYAAVSGKPDLPACLGRYRVASRLGGGGMGDVYLAHDPQLNNRPVAVKVPRFDAPPELREALRRRFLQEAASAASVPHHAHVCPVYDHGEHDGRPFLVMAYVEGGSLADRLKGARRFEDVREAVRLVRQAAEGLTALHAAGVVHRDLKPGNILLDRDGRPLLTDFGLARSAGGEGLTSKGQLLGTPAYMAPEQAEHGAAAAREPADVYGLGAVLYHLLTGRAPYAGDTLQVLRQMSLAEPPTPSSLRAGLDPALEAVVRRAMARRPADRPTAAALAATLGNWLDNSTAQDAQPLAVSEFLRPTASETPKAEKRNRWVALARRSQPLADRPGLPPATRSWGRARGNGWTVGVGLLLLLGIGGSLIGWRRTASPGLYRDDRAPDPVEAIRQADHPPPDHPLLYHGALSVRVWDPAHPARRQLRLNQPGALPLRAGDQVRVEAEVDPPAYLYVVVIDPAGLAKPLYPWKPGEWNSRPADEKPRETLSLPEAADEEWRVTPGPAGMETLLLLARPKPLTAAEEAELKAAVTGLGPQAAQGPRSVVWFENGEEVKNDEAERASDFDAAKVDDPVLRTQTHLREKLRRLFPYTRAVSYANAGKSP